MVVLQNGVRVTFLCNCIGVRRQNNMSEVERLLATDEPGVQQPPLGSRRRPRLALLASLSFGLLAAAAALSARPRTGRDGAAGRGAAGALISDAGLMNTHYDMISLVDDVSLVERFEIVDPLSRNRLHRIAVATLRRDALMATQTPLRLAVRYAPVASALPPLWSRAIVVDIADDGGGDATVRFERPPPHRDTAMVTSS